MRKNPHAVRKNPGGTSGSNILDCIHMRFTKCPFGGGRRVGNVAFNSMKGNARVSRLRMSCTGSSTFR